MSGSWPPRALLGPLLALALYALGSVASARETIGIEYSATARRCPSEREFTAQVLERTDQVELAPKGRGARQFIVRLAPDAGQVAGSLVIREADGTESVARTLRGYHCAEVALALALATALAIDPEASFAPREDNLSPERPPGERASSLPSDAPLADEGAPAVGLAAGPALATGFAPELGLGVQLLLERYGTRVRSNVYSVGVELVYLVPPEEQVAGATSSFELIHARPHACILPTTLAASLRVVPCVGAELGVLQARGADLPNPADARRFWGAASLGLRLVWDLDATWFLDVTANALVPFMHYRFVFQNPETEVHEVGPLGIAAGLRAGGRF